MVQNRDLFNVSKQSAGYRLFEEYLTEYAKGINYELVSSYRDKDGNDISDILRGKLMAVNEILGINIAIDEYIKLHKSVVNE